MGERERGKGAENRNLLMMGKWNQLIMWKIEYLIVYIIFDIIDCHRLSLGYSMIYGNKSIDYHNRSYYRIISESRLPHSTSLSSKQRQPKERFDMFSMDIQTACNSSASQEVKSSAKVGFWLRACKMNDFFDDVFQRFSVFDDIVEY